MMSDRYIVFVEVHSHNLRHFRHQQRWAVFGFDRNTGYSRQSLRAYCSTSSNLTSTLLKPSLPSLFMSFLISLIWLFTPSLCSFTWPLFCVLNTKKNALPIMILAACASETNDCSCFKEVFSLFSNKLQNGWKLSMTPTSPVRMTSRWPETLEDPVKIRDWNKLGYQLTVSLFRMASLSGNY